MFYPVAGVEIGDFTIFVADSTLLGLMNVSADNVIIFFADGYFCRCGFKVINPQNVNPIGTEGVPAD